MGHCCSNKHASCSLREAKAITAPSVYTYVSHQPVYDKVPSSQVQVERECLAICGRLLNCSVLQLEQRAGLQPASCLPGATPRRCDNKVSCLGIDEYPLCPFTETE